MAAVDSTVGAPRRTGCGQQFPAQVEKLLHGQVGEIVGAQVALRLQPDQLDQHLADEVDPDAHGFGVGGVGAGSGVEGGRASSVRQRAGLPGSR
jgi:hypothetical protein